MICKLVKKFKEFLNIRKELCEADSSFELSPGMLAMAVCVSACLAFITIRERHINSLPPYIQQRIRRQDKRMDKKRLWKKKAILRNTRIRKKRLF